MSRRRIVSTLAATFIGLIASGAVAYAEQTGPGSEAMPLSTVGFSPFPTLSVPSGKPTPKIPRWPAPTICTEAAFTESSAWTQGGLIHISIVGWIRPCPGSDDPGALRSFYVYGATGAVRSSWFWTLGDFSVSGARQEPITAVCVIDSYRRDGRRACVGVDQSDSGFVVRPIPVDDARLNVPHSVPAADPVSPFCGTCL